MCCQTRTVSQQLRHRNQLQAVNNAAFAAAAARPVVYPGLSPTSLVAPVRAPGMLRRTSSHSGLIRPGQRGVIPGIGPVVAPMPVHRPVSPMGLVAPHAHTRPRVLSTGALPRPMSVPPVSMPPVVNYNVGSSFMSRARLDP